MVSKEQRAAVEAVEALLGDARQRREEDVHREYVVSLPLETIRFLHGTVAAYNGVLAYDTERAEQLHDDEVAIDDIVGSVHLAISKLATTLDEIEENSQATGMIVSDRTQIPVTLKLRDMDVINNTYDTIIEREQEKVFRGDSFGRQQDQDVPTSDQLTPTTRSFLAVNEAFVMAGAPVRPLVAKYAG